MYNNDGDMWYNEQMNDKILQQYMDELFAELLYSCIFPHQKFPKEEEISPKNEKKTR